MAGKQMTKQDSQEFPNIQCAEDISLLDIPQLSTLAKCWNVDMSGLEGKKDIEDRLITFWTSNRKKEQSDAVSYSCFIARMWNSKEIITCNIFKHTSSLTEKNPIFNLILSIFYYLLHFFAFQSDVNISNFMF
jgi:hypothetical protein